MMISSIKEKDDIWAPRQWEFKYKGEGYIVRTAVYNV